MKFKVMHVSPPYHAVLACICHGPSSVHAQLRRTADTMESVRCVSSRTSSEQTTGRTGEEASLHLQWYSCVAPAVIQLCCTAAAAAAAAPSPSPSSADQRPAAGSHCNTGDVVKPAAGLNTLLSRQSLQRAGPQRFTATGQSELIQ